MNFDNERCRAFNTLEQIYSPWSGMLCLEPHGAPSRCISRETHSICLHPDQPLSNRVRFSIRRFITFLDRPLSRGNKCGAALADTHRSSLSCYTLDWGGKSRRGFNCSAKCRFMATRYIKITRYYYLWLFADLWWCRVLLFQF
jgi:hypothetical protein